MSKKLQSKVAVIIGGNSGIGLATARRFAAEGVHFFINGRRQAELDEAVAQLGRNVTGVPADVSNLADLDRLFATVMKCAPGLDRRVAVFMVRRQGRRDDSIELNLDSLDRRPCAIGGLSRRSRGRIPEPVWQSQRMRRCETMKGAPVSRVTWNTAVAALTYPGLRRHSCSPLGSTSTASASQSVCSARRGKSPAAPRSEPSTR
jgi:NAD(P)-dependent dehydrogenase (short-subunit alcohol dehydrogenase family)